jgi:hypothetical protein
MTLDELEKANGKKPEKTCCTSSHTNHLGAVERPSIIDPSADPGWFDTDAELRDYYGFPFYSSINRKLLTE